MNEAPPLPSKKTKPCPKARQRSERRQHILELLTTDQPRTTDEIGYFARIPSRQVFATLSKMEEECYIRRVYRGRGKFEAGTKNDAGPATWALRCWKEGA
jgi:hypothetical protein